jgi:CO/xanthine dehydrogenase Mo-binding subunit
VHLADFEVDPETMAASIVSYTAFQNVGKAVHPDYAEGQMQCGAVQGIGWALKEESVYGSDGKLQNEGFLDDRIPVALDLPPIGTVILEIPNSGHPYGVRGVGESPIVPPLSSESNAVSRLFGTRLRSLSMSPAKILAEIDGE